MQRREFVAAAVTGACSTALAGCSLLQDYTVTTRVIGNRHSPSEGNWYEGTVEARVSNNTDYDTTLMVTVIFEWEDGRESQRSTLVRAQGGGTTRTVLSAENNAKLTGSDGTVREA